MFADYCVDGNDKQFHHRSTTISVYGHSVHIPVLAAGRRCAKFSFQDLCGKAYGAADYIALGEMFTVVAIADVPVLTISNRNEVFIHCFLRCHTSFLVLSFIVA